MHTSLRGQAAQRGAHKPVASGGIVAEELSVLGLELGQPGAHGADRRQLLRVWSSCRAVPPFVRSIASKYPSTLGSHGVPQWDRGDDTDKGSGGSCKGRSQRSSPPTQTGATARRYRGVFLAVPPSRGGLRSFVSPYSHTANRKWAASAAAAKPWFARPRPQGRQPHMFLKMLTEAA